MLIGLKQITTDPALKSGCIVDTNVLIATAIELDPFNDWAEKLFLELSSANIPVFTNINIRSEFIDISRRILIAEALLDFYDIWKDELSPTVSMALKSLKTRIDKAAKEDRIFKLSDIDIKRYKSLLNDNVDQQSPMSWANFCEVHFKPYISIAWDIIVEKTQVQFLGTRAIESKEFFDGDPKWADMIEIVGKTGIGTSDAMIINLFLKSKLPMIVTADSDVRDAVVSMMPQSKFVLAP